MFCVTTLAEDRSWHLGSVEDLLSREIPYMNLCCDHNPERNTVATLRNICFSSVAPWVSCGSAGSLAGLAMLNSRDQMRMVCSSHLFPEPRLKEQLYLLLGHAVLPGEAGAQRVRQKGSAWN